MFEVFEHTADLGLRIRAGSFEELLVEAAKGLTSVIVTDLATIEERVERTIRIDGQDVEYLLFDWLSELLFAFETERLLFHAFQLDKPADGIVAVCRGEHLDAARHQLEHEVKAITYHRLKVIQTDRAWEAEVVVDI